MAEGDYKNADGSGNTGQTTLGEGTRKLTPQEANFQRGRGVEGFRCGDCIFFENGACRIVDVENVKADDTCDEYEPDRRGNMSTDESMGTVLRWNDYSPAYIKRRKFSKEKRMQLAKSGKALPHGGFPIENCGDVKNAIRAIGRAKDRGSTITHIKSRHSALGCKNKLPASWKSMANKSLVTTGPFRRITEGISLKHLLITKVSEDKQTGERRWYAKASGVERDLYDERMSLALFKDFIKRVESRDEVPEAFSSKAWNGGLPYLGVAHYLDLGGIGIIGPTEQLWVDGNLLKARGMFEDNPMADAAFKSIEADIDNKVPLEERVRISIAFIDWGHEHEGEGKFARRSLVDRCKMCADGLGEKIYLAGHLVHLALTRVPAYPTATIELEERAMSKQKFADAESIVGEDQANLLEEKDQELIGRTADSDIDPNAVVVKQDERKARAGKEEAEEEDEDEGGGDKKKKGNSSRKSSGGTRYSSYGGAESLIEAEEFLVSEADGSPVLLDSFNALAGVLTNIVGEDHAEAVQVSVAEFRSLLDRQNVATLEEVRDFLTQKEAIMAEANEQEVLEPQAEAEAEAAPVAADAEAQSEVEPGESEHPLDAVLTSLKAAYDEARETPVDEGARLQMLQEPVNDLAMALKSSISDAPQDAGVGITMDQITQAMAVAVAPLQAEVAALKAGAASAPVERAAPARRAIQSGSLLEAAPVARAEPQELAIMESDFSNPKTDKNVTPGIRALVRKSVGAVD